MSRFFRVCLAVGFLYPGFVQAQTQGDDVVQALRQQREEAQDKLATSYATIMRLQRELDKMKAEEEKKVKGLESPK